MKRNKILKQWGQKQGETSIQTAIMNYLRSTGWKVIRFNNTGMFDPTLKMYRKNVNEPGISDVVAMKGVTAWIEIKIPSEKSLVERVDVNRFPEKKSHVRIWNQKRFLKEVREKGCKGFFAYSVDDVIRELEGVE